WPSPAAIPVIAIIAVYLLALVIVFTALGTIFRTGTYVYATTGQAPSNMDPALLQAAFRKKERGARPRDAASLADAKADAHDVGHIVAGRRRRLEGNALDAAE